MPNTIYNNFILANEIADQLDSKLNLMQFCTVDNNLELVPGMKKRVHVYTATSGTEKLTMGKGNSKSITTTYTPKDYDILLAQNRFEFYDEEAMIDPTAIETGLRMTASDLYNTMQADIFAEFNKATLEVTGAKYGFDAFVDAQSLLEFEDLPNRYIFGIVSPKDEGAIRKALKDDLKYVEPFARQGYLGTVAGIHLFTKKNAVKGTVCVATKKAVTFFNKTGVNVENIVEGVRGSDEANIRKNTRFARKYYVPALTDTTQAVKITFDPPVV